MMIIENKYAMGQKVYLVTDVDQLARIVTKIYILPNELLVYEVSCGSSSCDVYDFELSEEKQTILS